MNQQDRYGLFTFILLSTFLVVLSFFYLYSQVNHVLSIKSDEIFDIKEQLKDIYNKIEMLNNEIKDLRTELQNKEEMINSLIEQTQKNTERLDELSIGPWMTFTATYYDAHYESTGKRPGDPGFGITASGRPVQDNVTVAVDPKVIPLGSWVQIEYPDGKIETRRADDTGRLIKGRRIDIYVPKASRSLGKHKVRVRMIHPPESP